MARWIVEVTPDSFEDVGAHALELEGGCLVFRDDTYKITVAYSATEWRTVAEAAD
jgi:hypothetical protein